ncbi:MAG TPA: hypothetical protein VHC49_16075 [Mycobacteriales bacterium]|nr:hypothetical protein [Mycobacteriales bacterium]
MSVSSFRRPRRRGPTALQVVAEQRYVEQARSWLKRNAAIGFLACLAGYVFGFLAAGWKGGVVGLAVVAVFAACAGAAMLWRRLTVSIIGAILTIALVSSIVGKLFTSVGWGGDATVVAASLWCLTLVGLLGAWRVRRHAGNRATTSLACDAVVIVAALISSSTDGAIILGFLGVLGILAVRGGALLSLRVFRARIRSRLIPRGLPKETTIDTSRFVDSIQDDAALVSGMERERLVSAELGELDLHRWSILQSRRLPGSGDVIEHLLIGPPGIVVCFTAHWNESVTLTEVPTHGAPGVVNEVYTLDGSSELLARRLEPILVATRQVAWTLDVHPDELRCLVIFSTGGRQLPEPVVEIDLLSLWDPERETTFDATAYLVSINELAGFLQELPRHATDEPGRLSRFATRLRGGDPEVAQRHREDRYTRDLAAICDQLFIPV